MDVASAIRARLRWCRLSWSFLPAWFSVDSPSFNAGLRDALLPWALGRGDPVAARVAARDAGKHVAARVAARDAGKHVRVTFVGASTREHALKLGRFPMFPSAPTRTFAGGETVAVEMEDSFGKHGCVDLTFDDGEFALGVSRALFSVRLQPGEEGGQLAPH